MTRVAINGFGRIGRNFLRRAVERPGLEVAAVNDLTNAATLAYLLKYDSLHGRFRGEVDFTDEALLVNGREIQILAQRDPARLPWRDLGIDVVIESTGLFTSRAEAQKHLASGAKKVIISAPAKNDDITIVLGVNQEKYSAAEHHLISSASPTTHCAAVLAKILHENYRIVCGTMTAVHAYTNEQKVLDLPHEDMRQGRAAALSIIPVHSGAAKTLGLVLPELKGKIECLALRVPIPNVTLVELVAQTEKKATVPELNELYRLRSLALPGILNCASENVVSVDFMSDTSSCIFDASLTAAPAAGQLVKLSAWYDNEAGYSARLVELVEFLAVKGI
ncbi:glyceraldehyde-3-phosphate dehydrogenase [Candidatus Termititenax persephonae]|uniref:Glyceraldehyde-3-phosphate dehydrogenase n=1 Tax=Candidatus Termititenax persephonae TaxID=2218525 RepID=A0A388THT0_9BACT|nr:glyceraldehyde-3-phosphate dehydrogenase [Candidatus Termititenax persephonae]